MAHGLLRSVVIFAGMFLLGGCAAFPEYRVMLQWNPDDFDYTLWVCDESGCVSSLQYNVSFSHLLKTYRRGEGVLELEPLEEGNEPEFFDLFRILYPPHRFSPFSAFFLIRLCHMTHKKTSLPARIPAGGRLSGPPAATADNIIRRCEG